ncbi:glycosyltransferase family 1 protein [Neobacillus muris]|uniref:glycosyltransferase family 1 protein n=1 Tax=Neobacillus muris TaxID=2941334 RepID=UPI0020405366|nr:glycosyltransferase family 1 protein [Neobacillus muris]
MDHPVRVLHIVSVMDRGGAETLLMNIYRNIDRTLLQFDFVTHTNKKGDFDDEINSLGGVIYKIPSLGESGLVGYIKELVKIMKRGKYAAVHSHTDYQGGVPALAAKISGIEKRICHSHSNNWPLGNHLKAQITLKILQRLMKAAATDFCSCSMEAAEFLFGKKMISRGKVIILKNGIDLTPFQHEQNGRESVIKELNLPEKVKIIGHVGHFSKSKNHRFILKVLRKIIELDPDFVALLAGEGPLRKQIEIEAEKMGLMKNIRFLGKRDDIPRLIKAFDVFIFPSLFEGFGIVTLEAQCVGTACVVSDRVPFITDMGLNLVTYLDLEEDVNVWVQAIFHAALKKRPPAKEISANIIKRGFSIQDNIPYWLSLYNLNNTEEGNRLTLNL